MFLTVPWEILILGKLARCMFCIIMTNYIVNYNCFSINREKLGNYSKWTDYTCSEKAQRHSKPLSTRYAVFDEGERGVILTKNSSQMCGYIRGVIANECSSCSFNS